MHTLDGQYAFYLRDRSLRWIAQIDDFSNFQAVLNFNGVSKWSFTFPVDHPAFSMLSFGYGLVVTRNDVEFVSGPFTSIKRVSSEDEDTVKLEGVDDTISIADRLVLPVHTGPPYTAAAYDTFTGKAETAMYRYVSRNCGPDAKADRKITGMILAADLARGNTVTVDARFDLLIEFLNEISAKGGGLGFKVLQVGDPPQLQFQVYEPVDRQQTAEFSYELGTLESFEYSMEAPTGNYVFVAGTGEGTARTILEAGDGTSIVKYNRRIELFVDQRSEADPTALQESLLKALQDNGEKVGLQIKPIDTARTKFMEDYFLGDKVSVILDDVRTVDLIRSIQVDLDADGERVTPSVGTPTLPTVLRLFSALQNMRGRISNLERR